ncbi:MAG: hypothetical protein LBG79_08255 [Spirochaetaceae bacterium]|jgi:hypothetical protein|nr:hypothetical protein [Spirochaetaceae bacterium]
MARDKGVYAPGELDRVKQRLGPVDDNEARRMQKILGGEIGSERLKSEAETRTESAPPKKPRRVVDIPVDDEAEKRRQRSEMPRRIPQARFSYFERIKIDSFCAEPLFGIKTPMQLFISKISFFKAPADLVSQHFVRYNLNEYYKHIEILVTTVRLVLPKGNSERTSKLKKLSHSAYLILDTFRQWKINLISQEIAKLQSRPRTVYVVDFQPMLREIYRPLYLLENLSIETDIEGAFNTLYKVMFLEAPTPETEADHKKMFNAIASYKYISESIHHLLYPLLMKNLAEECIAYEAFFTEYAEKYQRFLGVTEGDKIRSSMRPALQDFINEGEDSPEQDSVNQGVNNNEIQDLIDKSPEEKEREEEEQKAKVVEQKAFERGAAALEMLFPKAGWQRLNEYPDFYSYFAAILSFKKGCELISPLDPVQLALVLAAALEEIFAGFRSIRFRGKLELELNSVLDEWHDTFNEGFYNVYLKYIEEFVGVAQTSRGNVKTNYAMALINNIHWARRYYFFPLYEYKSGMPPTFQRKDIHSMFAISRRLRKVLTDIAADIESSNRLGGAKANAICDSIENPWEQISFEVANPISRRIDLLIPKEQRTNVCLVFFTIALATVLDNHMNSPYSIAYSGENKELFRSVNNEGREPILWVDKRTDVESIFKESLAQRKK